MNNPYPTGLSGINGSTDEIRLPALTLAKALTAKRIENVQLVADTNPALLREWTAELTAAYEQSKQELDLVRTALATLRAAEQHGTEAV